MNVLIFKTKFGWIGIKTTEIGICRIILPKNNKEEVINKLQPIDNLIVDKLKKLLEVQLQIIKYFDGQKINFNYDIDITNKTLFQQKVLKTVLQVPYGEIKTYKWIAEKISLPNSVRAVGQVLKNNPIPLIIPCHRIICSNGDLGGFNTGKNWKRRLLVIEKSFRFIK